MEARVEHLNPPGLPSNPAYSQGGAVSGNVTTIYIGGQNAVDASGSSGVTGPTRRQSQ